MTKMSKLLLISLCGAALLLFQSGCGKSGKDKDEDAGPDADIMDTASSGDTSTESEITEPPDTGPGERCTENSCSGHGTCSEGVGTISCVCDTGYSGDKCSECAENYHLNPDGTCGADVVSADITADNFCSEVAKIICNNMLICCDHNVIQQIFGVAQVWSNQDECSRDVELFCLNNFDVLLFGLKAGTLTLAAESANACLNAMIPTSVDDCYKIEEGQIPDAVRAVAECEKMVQGAVQLNGDCHPDLFGNAECATDDLYCDKVTKKCLEKSDPEEVCGDLKPCKSNSVCMDGKCVALGAVDTSCAPWKWPVGIDGCAPPNVCLGFAIDVETKTKIEGSCKPVPAGAAKDAPCGPNQACADGTQCRPGTCNGEICYSDYDEACVGRCLSDSTMGINVDGNGLGISKNDKFYPDVDAYLGYHWPQKPPDEKDHDPCTGDQDCGKGSCVIGTQVARAVFDDDAYYDGCEEDEDCVPRCKEKPSRYDDGNGCDMDAGPNDPGGCPNFCKLDDEPCDPTADGGPDCSDICERSGDYCLPDGGCPEVCERNSFIECTEDDDCPSTCNNNNYYCEEDDDCVGVCNYWDGAECDNDNDCPGYCEFEANSPWSGWKYWWCDDDLDCPGKCAMTDAMCRPDEDGLEVAGYSDCPDFCAYSGEPCTDNFDCRFWMYVDYDYCYREGYCVDRDGRPTERKCDTLGETCPGDTYCSYDGRGTCMSADSNTITRSCYTHEDCDLAWLTEDYCEEDWCISSGTCKDDSCTEGECLDDKCEDDTCLENECITDECVEDTCTLETCDNPSTCSRKCDEISYEMMLCEMAQDFLGFFYFTKPVTPTGPSDGDTYFFVK